MTWANSVEPDQTLHCLLSALSKIVNYYTTTLESEMDPSFWQYCEIPLGIYHMGLATTTTTTATKTAVNKRIYQSPNLYLNYLSRLQYNFARMHFCDFIFQIQFCVEFLITKSTFLHHVGLEYSLLHCACCGRT